MIILSHPMTAQEIRVLQEFRRLSTQTLSLEAIKALKHPAGGGEEPALSLVAKGYLAGNNGGFTLTPKGAEFLTLDPKPLVTVPHNPEAAVSEEEEGS
jgi:hypothetical protein